MVLTLSSSFEILVFDNFCFNSLLSFNNIEFCFLIFLNNLLSFILEVKSINFDSKIEEELNKQKESIKKDYEKYYKTQIIEELKIKLRKSNKKQNDKYSDENLLKSIIVF